MPCVAMFAYDGCYANSLANPQDMLHIANNHWRAQQGTDQGCFHWSTLSLGGKPVTTASGLRLHPDGDVTTLKHYNVVYLASMPYEGNDAFCRRIEKLQPISDWLRHLHRNKTVLVGHCTSSFLLAESGLLAGGRATTSWWMADIFKRRYPDIELHADKLIVEQPDMMSGGAANSDQLITLRLIERYMGQAIASLCAKTMMLDASQLEQTPYLMLHSQQEHDDPLVAAAQRWLQRHLRQAFSLEKLAKHLAVSPRTLIRRFKQAVDDTPNSYIQNLRVDTAKRLLETSSNSIEKVMAQVGYTDISSFSRLFKRKTGLTPKAYRTRFGSLG